MAQPPNPTSQPNPLESILLAGPRSFCAGVDRAIEIVERALELFPKPIYVRKEIVHNRFVVDLLAAKGAVFVDELNEIPEGAVCIFSAHGVSPQIRDEAQRRNLRAIDATCPLVIKVHKEVLRYVRAGNPTALIGHAGHEETEGTLGEAPDAIQLIQKPEDVDSLTFPKDAIVRYASQTTLSLDDTAQIIERLVEKYPNTAGPSKEDICYATQNRQNAVKEVARRSDTVLVLGASNSSNSRRLMEVAQREGARAFLIPNAEALEAAMVKGAQRVGVTAGASTPEVLVEELIEKLKDGREIPVERVTTAVENVRFSLPPEVSDPPAEGR